jgi:hypothetical protein
MDFKKSKWVFKKANGFFKNIPICRNIDCDISQPFKVSRNILSILLN